MREGYAGHYTPLHQIEGVGSWHDPALNRLHGVGWRCVEANPSDRGECVNEVDDPFEQQQLRRRLAQSSANENAVKAL